MLSLSGKNEYKFKSVCLDKLKVVAFMINLLYVVLVVCGILGQMGTQMWVQQGTNKWYSDGQNSDSHVGIYVL